MYLHNVPIRDILPSMHPYQIFYLHAVMTTVVVDIFIANLGSKGLRLDKIIFEMHFV